jgi:hypothetical protein
VHTHRRIRSAPQSTETNRQKPMNITISLVGTSPLLMHNPRLVDPNYQLSREIKIITDKKKMTDEDLDRLAMLEWYGGLYETNGEISQPTSKVRKCLINTARMSRLGKAVERSLSFRDMNVPLEYEGSKDIDELFANPRYHSRLSVGIGTKRVMRVRPSFFPWGLSVSGFFMTDAGLKTDELRRIVELAGTIEGIGDNRVNGYGRFVGKMEVGK